ncbi:LysR substrate-binding domain-containing protein [Janthinobacterium agaricidamnosum]|uniref:Bacterial regulatory helix-turn-helix, lysR family protein n=1 Tax=Janthinobacterium agaricidamnosum NBRC 102515 = DSM 9628 TaxID=1349767 RepID=W0VBK8_9BURK|nr:LysR substrate-binding domain-containing protein [Janthinobacterium agaricidamnosum]CDG84985.1 bacterial regulatory helix-turn-helix, lysR family protein [Janthinobacterium agaricidamnosum NBRC 102515 = DSM 9628]
MDSTASAHSATLEIVLLRSFLEVVDRKGFAPAAERLALTASAVSGHIKRLEDSIGSRLMVRTTRRMELTAAGETLYAYARNIVELEREASARLRGGAIGGRLRIGASEDFAAAWLPQVLETFQRWHPQASIELKVGITAELLRQQDRGRLDAVFGKQCRRMDDIGELLWQEPLVWAYADSRALDGQAALPLAVFPEPCIYRESAIAALGGAARPWRMAFESSSMAGCLSAALAGFAVTPIARSQLRDGLRELGAADGLPPLPEVRFYAFLRKKTEATTALLRAVHEAGSRKRFARGSQAA